MLIVFPRASGQPAESLIAATNVPVATTAHGIWTGLGLSAGGATRQT